MLQSTAMTHTHTYSHCQCTQAILFDSGKIGLGTQSARQIWLQSLPIYHIHKCTSISSEKSVLYSNKASSLYVRKIWWTFNKTKLNCKFTSWRAQKSGLQDPHIAYSLRGHPTSDVFCTRG